MIVGQVVFLGGQAYVYVNSHGTLEKLPRMTGFRQLQLFILNRIGKVTSLYDVREFCKKHAWSFI